MQRTRKYTLSQLSGLLPKPDASANKYTRGKAVLVAGCADYPGAACLAALAAQRSGAGYVEVACAPEAVAQVRLASPSLVVRPWTQLAEYSKLDPDERGVGTPQLPAGEPSAKLLQHAIRAARPSHLAPRPRVLGPQVPKNPIAFLVGSGFDAADPLSESLTCAVLAGAASPVVVDGGGLDALATPEGRLILRQRFVDGLTTVVTPHAGEAARLARALDLPTDDAAVLSRLLSLAFGVVVMLKGPDTFVSDGDAAYRMPLGTSALAKAGTGDVLAGMTCALLAQGLSAVDACMLASSLHAKAGVAAAKRFGDICVIPTDVVDAIPQAVIELRRARDKASK